MTGRTKRRLKFAPETGGSVAIPVQMQPVPTVVAIPALNEEQGIGPALEALSAQRGLDGEALPRGLLQIVVLANNCTDATANVARAYAAKSAADPDAPPIHVHEITLAPEHANAGEARRAALGRADRLLDGHADALLCTTDADSRVYPDWIAQTWRERARGADVIAGTVEFDAAEAASLVLPEARLLEARYSALQAELMATVDPEPHNPWPNHVWAWGASLAVTRQAYRYSGGVPGVPLAEDRAFVDLLRQRDFRVRHSLQVRVRTSCRVTGRAPGGLADLIATYRDDVDYPCDAELLPANAVAERARCRALLRTLYGRVPAKAGALEAEALGVPVVCLRRALTARHFGEAFRLIEGESTRYYYVRLKPADLPSEIEAATALLGRLKRAGAGDRYDSARAATAGLWSASAERLQ